MKNALIIAAILIAVGTGVITFMTGSGRPTSATLPDNTTIIDVRTAEEFAAGHVKGAINFPVESMQAGQFPSIDKNTSIALYCHSGRRAASALNLLKSDGFTNVRNIGGLNDLKLYGLEATQKS